MAVDSFAESLQRLLYTQLAPQLRYRALLIQCTDLGVLRVIEEKVSGALLADGRIFTVVQAQTQFDAIGAKPCRQLIDDLEKLWTKQHLLLTGPLHFLDFWPPPARSAFWSHFATVTSSPGIIIFDVPRDIDTEDIFKVMGKIPGTDARYLKSRLAATQDGLV